MNWENPFSRTIRIPISASATRLGPRTPVGVDIERVRPVSVRAMERIAGVRTEAAFFRSWVRREARVKRTGSGIVTMMRTEAPLNRGEFYYEVDAFHGYAAGVAAGQPEPPQPVHRLMLDQLL